MDFLVLQIFMGFMQGYESGKDKWYKLPLVGVLPQASLRLTTADRGRNSSSSSITSTPPVVVTDPCRGVSRQCDAAMLGLYRCAGAAFLVCCHSAPAAHLAIGWWCRNLGTRPSVWWGSVLRWSWNWWTGGLVPVVPTPRCWHCAMTNHRPHVDVSAVADEVMVSVLLLFWSCYLSFCQVNQKIYAYELHLVEREGWLANGNYTNRIPHWAAESHL
jgi:hypothetical protein